LQVNFGAGYGAVSQIGREERQFGSEICALPIPGEEAMHGEVGAERAASEIDQCSFLFEPIFEHKRRAF
jgi:hypothetical protein